MTIYSFKVTFHTQGMEYLDRVLQSNLRLLFENLINWAGKEHHNYQQFFLSNCTLTRFEKLAANIVKTYQIRKMLKLRFL